MNAKEPTMVDLDPTLLEIIVCPACHTDLELVEDDEGGHSHGSAPAPEQEHAEAAGSADDTARWLGGAGLLVGALGVGIGAGALARSRGARGKDAS